MTADVPSGASIPVGIGAANSTSIFGHKNNRQTMYSILTTSYETSMLFSSDEKQIGGVPMEALTTEEAYKVMYEGYPEILRVNCGFRRLLRGRHHPNSGYFEHPQPRFLKPYGAEPFGYGTVHYLCTLWSSPTGGCILHRERILHQVNGTLRHPLKN